MGLTKEEFAEQVKDALVHIYDLAYLPQLELTRLLIRDGDLSWEERTQGLRRTLLQAIERLDPGPALLLRARERRSYAILSACYARSMTAWAVMEELAISERQYWRDRKKAIASLVGLLWADYIRMAQGDGTSLSLPGEQEVVARDEADLMVSRSSPEDLNPVEIIRQAIRALQKLIEAKGVQLRMEISNPGLIVVADRTVLRQICLNLLSYAFRLAADGCVSLRLTEGAETVEVIVCVPRPASDETPPMGTDLGLKIVQRLVEAQSGSLRVEARVSGGWSAIVSLPTAQTLPVLVVDDNEATIKLFQRYVAGSRYRVVGARTGQEALRLLSQLAPAAITLDVMMPDQDGWDTLQGLRAIPELQDTPMIVCSILDEPQLAYSLGADDFIRKPVKRATLLQTLNRWLSRSHGGVPLHPGATEDT